jgi:hypothetical protein
MLKDLGRVLLILSRWQTTVWAVDHVRNLGGINMSCKLRILGVSIYAVVKAFNALRLKSSVLLTHWTRANA